MKVGVELGVQAGAFAEHNLKIWKSCQRYYLVDTYKSQPNYRDFANVDDRAQEALMAQAAKRLEPWAKLTRWLRMSTGAAARQIHEPLDFVYVDARHDYCAVKGELEVYWPMIRAGGILAGYAYATAAEGPAGADWALCRDGNKHDGGVKAAVDEFAAGHGLPITVTYRDTMPYSSWLIRKPDNSSSLKTMDGQGAGGQGATAKGPGGQAAAAKGPGVKGPGGKAAL